WSPRTSSQTACAAGRRSGTASGSTSSTSRRTSARHRRLSIRTTTRGPDSSGRTGPGSWSARHARKPGPDRLDRVRALTLEEFLAESGATPELVARLEEVGALVPLPDGRYDAREQVVARGRWGRGSSIGRNRDWASIRAATS